MRLLTLLLITSLLALLPALASAEADLGKGKDSFAAVCGKCHALDRALNATKTAEGWKATVARMSANFKGRYGNPIPDATAESVVAYLAAKDLFGATCSRCHGVDKALGARKDPGGWEATVKRMSDFAKDTFEKPIPAAEQKTIVQYLVLNAGK